MALTLGTDVGVCWQKQVTSLPSAVVMCWPWSIISMEVTSLPVSIVFTTFCVRMSHTLQDMKLSTQCSRCALKVDCVQQSTLYEACCAIKHTSGLSSLL